MKPYKVYKGGRLFDIVYFSNGTPPETVKQRLVKDDGYPDSITVKHYINIRERK